MTHRWVLASGNQGKAKEISARLEPLGIELVTQKSLDIESVPETGTTFVENAVIKARHAARESGMPALADDSGICVSALNSLPGVRSARFAGEQASDSDNLEKLLRELGLEQDRSAYFYCVLVLMRSELDATPLIAEGRWNGQILHARQGDGGFGYDPVFFLPEFGISAAEMPLDQKNQLSHRALAMQQLLKQLEQRQSLQ